MIFPSIYFKTNTTDYAAMPYTADSCFKYIAADLKHISEFVIWRDSSETDKLTNRRIKKLKIELNKYTPNNKINIRSMGKAQKISQSTISKGIDNTQNDYLLSLNNVLDISKTRLPIEKKLKKPHAERPRLFCWHCWRLGRFWGQNRVPKK